MNIENVNKEDQIKRILENMPTELELVADMPSGGIFYKKIKEDLPITVRAMKFEDERIIADATRKGIDPINIMLERCVNNIDITSLFVFDKLSLLLKIREATYGPDYEFTHTCATCKSPTQVSLDLNDLILSVVPEDFTGEEELSLPVLKKKAIIRHPRVKEEAHLTNLSHKTLWRFVVSIDGVVKKDILAEVMKQMPLQDIHALVKEIGGAKYGLDPKVNFSCPECEENEIINFPVGADFFYMS